MAVSDIRERIERFPRWHYEFDFDGVRTPIFDPGHRNRHEERRRYFFDPLVELCGGSLRGKRVLDLGCNAGFWSLCAIEAGCDFVLGVDGREMHVEQAELVFELREVDPSRYRFVQANVLELDLSDEPPFDVVLCLGLLYHVADPLGLLDLAAGRNSDLLVVDTSLSRAPGASFRLAAEPADDPRSGVGDGLVLVPTRSAVETAVGALGYAVSALRPRFTSWEGCLDYRIGTRRAFLCAKRTRLDEEALDVERHTPFRGLVDAAFSAVYPNARALRARRRRR
jgi:SAM-dependent methyltransferase